MRHFALYLFFLSLPAFGLTTAYVTFDHPDGWGCELAQGVWICQATSEIDRKDAVILSIATLATDWDSLDNYESYLKQPRSIQDESGTPLTATVSYARRRNINGVTWMDSLQHNSELPGFWARYLATVHVTGQTKLAILITYIVSDQKYSKFAPQFERMVASLRPNEDFNLDIATKQGDGPLPGSEVLGPKRNSLIAERLGKAMKDKEPEPKATASSDSGSLPLLVVGGGVAVIALILLRRRRQKPKGKSTGAKSAQRPPSRKSG